MSDTTVPSLPLFDDEPLLDDPNQAPDIVSDGGGLFTEISIAEVTTAVTTVVATDPEGTTPSYAIVGGEDQGHFQIDAVSGVLTFLTAPDFLAPTDADGDSIYMVEVAASDGELTDTQVIQVTVTGTIGHDPTVWKTEAAGDFDGDGDVDMLWRHRDGAVKAWVMENGERVADHEVAFAARGWRILTTGDLDGDGDADILWRHRDGAVVSWEMEDGQYVRNHNLAVVSGEWRAEAIADLDGDGDGDILWRHRDGRVVNWEMEDGDYVRNHNLAVASRNWVLEGTADLDRDGDADLLWSHRDGALVTWETEGGDYVATHLRALATDFLG